MPLQRLNSSIKLDGVNNEPAWEAIPPLPLVMNSPTYKGTPTQRTEIRIAYDKDYLYAAGRFYDTDAANMRATSLVRDGNGPADDIFCLLIDNFNDNENALGFTTSPSGNRGDFTVFNDAETQGPPPFNESWNTFWDVAVSTNGEGWFVEMRIPFSSLRFQDRDGRVVMGIVAWRYYPRNNETVVFPDIPPKWAWGIMKPSVAQDVVLDGVHSRNPLYVAPYVLGGVGHEFELNNDSTAYARSESRQREIGLDLKYGITSNLTLDVTLNTDFAQVEADDQQVNLTRFSLFFPEKRLFFQERASIFDVSMGGPNRLFYSRTVGLSEEGPVRIFGGIRLVGRLGAWDVGFLDMQTDKSIDLPSENFGVLRLRRQVVNENSYAGAMVTSRVGRDGSYNFAYGLDGIFRVSGDDYLILNWAQTFDDELVRAKNSTLTNILRARFGWEKRTNQGFGYEASFSYSGPDFDPAMGFAPRVDVTRVGDRVFYGWRPDEASSIQNHILTFGANAFFRNTDGAVESAEIGPEWNVNFKSGAFGRLAFKVLKEALTESFELSDNVEVPVGRYQFYNLSAFYQTPWGGLLQSGFNLDAGTFYDGTRVSAGFVPTWTVSQHLQLSGEYQLNRVRLENRNQEFDAHIARFRVKATLNTELSSATFIQYSSDFHDVTVNLRLRYNPREGNDLYLVYNEGLNTDRFRERPVLPSTSSRTVLLKYTYTFTL